MSRTKPAKPYKDFPLFPHGSGQWAKKIRGKLWYFGVWENTDEALQRFVRERDIILAGGNPRIGSTTTTPDGHTVAQICNHYLTSQERKVADGELVSRTFADYVKTGKRVAEFFGRETIAGTLKPAHFTAFRRSFPKSWGARTVGREIRQTRGIFKHAAENELLDHIPNFGTEFKEPKRRVVRKGDRQRRIDNGLMMFEASEVRTMLKHARHPWRAMILLGVNCGMGNTDLANLPRRVIDLDGGWLVYGRQKTGIDRSCPLWPETVEAVRDVISKRGEPKNFEDSDVVFLTKFGNRFVRETQPGSFADGISEAFAKMLRRWEMKRPGLNFYSLRRTFETVAQETGQQNAVDYIMGHCDHSMASVYRQRFGDKQLLSVSEHVREWLFDE